MPRITAATVVEHRELRRAALLDAAATLMTRGKTFTVAEIATEVGLSRSAVYEYYSSAADLIADVLVDELADWAEVLRAATAEASDPSSRSRHGWPLSWSTSPAATTHSCGRQGRSICRPPDVHRCRRCTASSSRRCRMP